MKLHAVIADDQTDIQFRDEGSRAFAQIDDRTYELEVRDSPEGFLLIRGGEIFNCRIQSRPESGQLVIVTVGTVDYTVTLTDPKRLRGAAGATTQADKAARIVAQMPGKVVRVLVEVGEQVETGAGIIVVEAMKMQNEMKSPIAGTVVTINVTVGATVNAGDVLAVIEELDH